MNGTKFFLDTNAIIALLKGNQVIGNILKDASWIGISVISVLEFLSFPYLSFEDKIVFLTFIERVEVIDVTSEDISFLEDLAHFKIDNNLKLADSIIAVYCLKNKAILITNDKQLLNVKKLTTHNF